MAASVNASANPFVGGAQQRNLAPPGVGGAIGSANTRVSAPAAGVAPTQIKLVPLNDSNKLFLKNEMGKTEWRTETEDLRATTLAFVMGVRGNVGARRVVTDPKARGDANAGYEYNVAYQPNIMPGMPGTERFQQLCSLEYLQMYFAQVLCHQTIELGTPLFDVITNVIDESCKTSGPVGAYRAAVSYANDAGVGQGQPGNPEMTGGPNTTLLKGEDIARKSGLLNSDANLADPNYQGIFARDFGPFLKGKGSATQLVSCTEGNHPSPFGTKPTGEPVTAQPFSVSRNAGDDLAFAVLDSLLMKNGCTDWRPDGIVLSKGANDPSDKLSDEYLEARDGQLYNIRVQGPAIGTSWTGERSLETLPLDKVFVVLVADVWFDGARAKEAAETDTSSYEKMRREALDAGFDEGVFREKQKSTYTGVLEENTVLCNFRVQVSTSSQMINHSNYDKKGNVQPSGGGYKRARLESMSRMGLKLCNQFGEYIVGGWQIGQVMDTSASRAAMPSGSLVGVRTAPNSSALNVNVNISWYTADRLARAFNNPEGSVVTRFNSAQRKVPENPVNMQVDIDGFEKAVAAEGAKYADAAANAMAKRLVMGAAQ